jgi:hypothetical protein
MDFVGVLQAIEGTALANAMRHSLWLYPVVEIFHIAGIALLVGTVAAFDFRLLGFASFVSVRALERSLLPWAWIALIAIVPSGLAMFAAHATDFATNPAFRAKLVLLAAAGVNVFIVHRGALRSTDDWDQHRPAPLAAKVAAVVSLAIWAGVISCGRLIAYL